MRLKGIEFGRVWGASGVQGFFGEGYRFHKYLKPIGLNFNGMTFVAKTTTLANRGGYMALREDFTPRDFYPDCIKVKFFRGIALNAVGLSGPGAWELLLANEWQKREKPFFLSFMAIGKEKEERLLELREFVRLLKRALPGFKACFGLQLNYTCPNTKHKLEELLREADEGLSIAAELRIPLMPKWNVLTPVEAVREVSSHPNCDGNCISNAIHYGQLPGRIPWEKLFGSASPLEEYGGGGLSGKLLLPLLIEWLRNARNCGIMKPINGGGGILSLGDAEAVLAAGADSISLGSIAFLRPWRVKGIIEKIGARS